MTNGLIVETDPICYSVSIVLSSNYVRECCLSIKVGLKNCFYLQENDYIFLHLRNVNLMCMRLIRVISISVLYHQHLNS